MVLDLFIQFLKKADNCPLANLQQRIVNLFPYFKVTPEHSAKSFWGSFLN